MRKPEPTIHVEEQGTTRIVSVSGVMEISNLSTFKNVMDQLFDDAAKFDVIIDFGDVEKLSSKAIGLMAGYARAARTRHTTLALCRVNARIYQVLNVLGTVSMFTMFESRESALASMSRS